MATGGDALTKVMQALAQTGAENTDLLLPPGMTSVVIVAHQAHGEDNGRLVVSSRLSAESVQAVLQLLADGFTVVDDDDLQEAN